MEPLDQFLVGHLNADFDLIFGEPEDAVRAFARKPPGVVLDARRAVMELLSRYDDDVALLEEATRRGCEFVPDEPGEFRELLRYAVICWEQVAATA